jgi:hypothetical protein
MKTMMKRYRLAKPGDAYPAEPPVFIEDPEGAWIRYEEYRIWQEDGELTGAELEQRALGAKLLMSKLRAVLRQLASERFLRSGGEQQNLGYVTGYVEALRAIDGWLLAFGGGLITMAFESATPPTTKAPPIAIDLLEFGGMASPLW